MGRDARGLDRIEKQLVERRWLGAVQHLADMGVGWNGCHSEQRLAVRPAMPGLQRARMTQKRGAAHEKHRECGNTDVSHAVFALTTRAFAPIGKTGADAFQLGDQGLQDTHRASESKIEARRQAKLPHTIGEGGEIHDLLHFSTRLVSRCQTQWVGP